MTEPDPQPEDQIFASAIEIQDHAEREHFLDNACKDAPDLRASLDELLALHDTDAEFLDKPILGVVNYTDHSAGDVIGGRYRLVEQIGEGGFGVVWKAYQSEPIQREVALKIMKQRFKQSAQLNSERQSLALMEHANIAMVFDAGTTDCGRAFFVMELVRGESIDKHCDNKKLMIEARLELFCDVCLAVHHAHQRGIIHRDIKPGNILVSTVDGGQVPKVIDFGIAKSLPLTDELEAESAGVDAATFAIRSAVEDTQPNDSSLPGILGTPDFMSPEQLSVDADIDTRADVYGLGGVLYLLLTGVSPRHGANREQAGKVLHRALLETEPPPLSVRLKHAASPDEIAKSRSTTRRGLDRQLRGELELITKKALAKDRTDRYSSAAEFAKDIERHLQLHPTSVAPTNAAYHFQKFVLRNRALTLAAVLVFAALVIGTVVATWGYLQAEASREFAEENGRIANRERAEAIRQKEQAMLFAATLEELIGSTNPERGISVDFTIRQMLDRFAASMVAKDRFANSPETKALLLRTIGRSYLTLRDLDQAEPHLREALETRQKLYGKKHPLLLESEIDYANYLFFSHLPGQAGMELDRILETLREQEPSHLIVQALTLRSGVASTNRQLGQAAVFAREAWDLSVEVHGEQHVITLQQKARLAQYLIRPGGNSDLELAEAMAREAYETTVKLHSDAAYDLAMAKWQFGGSLTYLGLFEEAEVVIRDSLEMHRKLLGAKSSFVVRDLVRLSFIRRKLGDWDDAKTLALEAVKLGKASTYDKEPTLKRAYNALRQVVKPGSQEEADTLGKLIEVVRTSEGQPHRLPRMLWQRALMLEDLGHREQAIACLEDAILIATEQGRTHVAESFQIDLDGLSPANPKESHRE